MDTIKEEKFRPLTKMPFFKPKAEVFDITDPNLDPTKIRFSSRTDADAQHYFERKIIDYLVNESITEAGFNQVKGLITLDFVTNPLVPSRWFAKEIWSRITDKTTYYHFGYIKKSIRAALLEKLTIKPNNLIYKTDSETDILLLPQDTMQFKNKTKRMIKAILKSRKYLIFSDLETLKEKNLQDERDLLSDPVVKDAGYCQQEQDAPLGSIISYTVKDFEAYKECQPCKKDLDCLPYLVLKMRFMMETIKPERVVQLEQQVKELPNYYREREIIWGVKVV